MSKQLEPAPSGEPMGGRVIYEYQITNLEGRILTLIEGLGLKDAQEKAVKDLFRDIYYPALYQHTQWVEGEILQPAIEASIKLTGRRVPQP